MQLQEIAKTFSQKNLPGSEVELTGEVPFDALAPYREHALEHLVERAEMPGFRVGKVPKDLVLKKIGEQSLLEEAVELFVRDFYPTLVETKQLDAVGRPEIRVTKLANGNPLGLQILATTYPAVALPRGWRDIGAKILLEPYTGDLPKADPMPSEEDQQKARAMIAGNIRRGKIIDELLSATTVEVPRLFIESEMEKIMGQLREDIGRMGIKFEDYLKHTGKTEAAVREEFKDQALKRAKLQLTLNKVAQEAELEADKPSVEHEMQHALEHFPNANKELLRIHVETVLKNELALKLLEGGVK